MPDSIVLLEERNEVTTFLLDEGTITATTVTTPTGETPGYEYAGNKVKVDDAVTLSANSDIGKPTVKKYTAAEGEIILGIAVIDPVTSAKRFSVRAFVTRCCSCRRSCCPVRKAGGFSAVCPTALSGA